jgi:hypothetical protein
MAFIDKENPDQSSVVTQQGQNLKCRQERLLDCIEKNSVVGVDQLVEKKDLAHACLGK